MPLLYLPLIIMVDGSQALIHNWVLSILVKKIFLALVFGVVFGWTANRMLKYSQYHSLIDKQSFIVFSLALTVKFV
jgi:putative effector of murein hydrolase LrgA (UPF0299 family)